MLSNHSVYAIAPAKDLERARKFYKEKLGFDPVMEIPTVLIYTSGKGTTFMVYETQFAGTAQNTALGWEVDNIEAEVKELKSRGVVFEEYDFPGLKTKDGIATTGDERSAWFKDSEGNILSVSQSGKK